LSKPDFRTHLLHGIRLFNERQFWHAHEAWETIWLAATSEVKLFLQGLIQLAAAYHHVQRGTTRGAPRLFEAALRKLAAFPAGYCGIDRAAAEAAARARSESYPVLTLLTTEDDVKPPRDDW